MTTDPAPPSFVLRVPRYDDVGIYAAFMADPQVTIWLEDRCQRPVHFHHAMAFVLGEAWCRLAIEYQGRFVGMTGLEDYDPGNGVARFFIVMGDKDSSNKGLGTAVTRALVTKGFRDLGLRKIVSNYFAPNVASRIIHARAGFSEEGVQRQVGWRRGEWVDHVLLSILREEWQRATASQPVSGSGS
ncbi:MAG: GNAT family protein [Sulfuritalea sp.]|nr:GNAT family protein [Sulfuritalea sp.]